jgi:DNA-binding transcriptional ArsR family regulator
MLSQRDRNVGEMAVKFAISLPAFSRHLRTLRQAGLVTERSEGRQRIYHLDPAPLRDVSEWLDRYERFWQGKLKPLTRHLEEKP